MKMSALGTPLTWMPAAEIKVRLRNAMGQAHGHFERDPAAERLADHVNAGELERLNGVEIEIGDVGDIIDPCHRTGRSRGDRERSRRSAQPALREWRAIPRARRCRADRATARPAARAKRKLAAVDLDRMPDKCHRHSPSRSAGRESVGEVGKRLKHFLAARLAHRRLRLRARRPRWVRARQELRMDPFPLKYYPPPPTLRHRRRSQHGACRYQSIPAFPA